MDIDRRSPTRTGKCTSPGADWYAGWSGSASASKAGGMVSYGPRSHVRLDQRNAVGIQLGIVHDFESVAVDVGE